MDEDAYEPAMPEVEGNRKRGAGQVAGTGLPLLGPMPMLTHGENTTPELTGRQVPPSPTSKQGPKSNKLTPPGPDKGTVMTVIASLNNDERLAGPQDGSCLKQ